MASFRSVLAARYSVSSISLAVLLAFVWIAGGASRADVMGQPFVRAAAWLALIIMVLFGERPAVERVRMPLIIVGAATLLVLLQLVPLPPSVWQALPGREILSEAANLSGEDQPWRPWSMVPPMTINAAGSLIVPIAVLVLIAGLRKHEWTHLPAMVLLMVVAGTLIGLLQATGAGFRNGLVNATPGDVSGTFANRNHFALFLAIGCIMVPVWTFQEERRSAQRGLVALGLVALFVLAILATGSRAGLAIGALAVILSLLLARQGLRRSLRRMPRWAIILVIAAMVGVVALLVGISVTADRAQSVNRLITIDAAQDTRVRAMPTVLAMVQSYFPAGIGFGSFDPLFRINEPDHLLKPTYFNHAHNDFLEVVLEGGAGALILMLATIAWWLAASVHVWRSASPRALMPRAGSAILLLILVGSIVDYPARTPMMMTIIAIAAAWLASGRMVDRQDDGGDALRRSGANL